ncbi:MAG: class I SAM-dependent rRNA methyltransferase [Firmicutes bacterium]|jgi:23S rRNA (cytosine1962-C5)-methyltransferase|nr:class I SAM-dependent rRNA methyltransferase [Bacillota bacterium]MDH7496465.1 class I SAM-dependent rRNA methyltransferase [Bacillota bacterium]
MPYVVLKRGREGRALARHPWVYKGEIDAIVGEPVPGDIVDVVDHRKRFLGRGFINPVSNITVRILTWDGEEIDEGFLYRRIEAARDYRRDVGAEAPCYRVVFSDGDMLSSLIVDAYEDVCVVQTLALGMDVRKDAVVAAVRDIMGTRKVYERNDSRARELEGLDQRSGFVGEEFPAEFWVRENGLKFRVDVARGQKTGLFLDQRENHKAIEPWCGGARVLDVFCYTGGFAVHAAAFGAREVLAVDSSAQALETARLNAAENGFDGKVSFVAGNAFDVLRQLEAEGETFDLVVVDPPAFAPGKRAVEAAYRGYKEVNLRAMRILAPEGTLVTCSCSYHMKPDAFLVMLADAAADAGREARLVDMRTQAKDHPVLLGVEETHYLKCAIVHVS